MWTVVTLFVFSPLISALLGGGLPLGSISLLSEDKMSSYYELLLRYFAAEVNS